MRKLAVTDTSGNSYLLIDAIDPIPGTTLRLASGGAPTNSVWFLSSQVRPTLDIGGVMLALEALGSAGELALFGETPSGDLSRWRDVYRSKQPVADRVAAVLLALAYQTDALRGSLYAH